MLSYVVITTLFYTNVQGDNGQQNCMTLLCLYFYLHIMYAVLLYNFDLSCSVFLW